MSDYSIGEVARMAGIASSAIRYYERVGLLPKAHRVAGKRRYSDDALSRLAVIKLAKEVGFTLAETKTLIDGIARGERHTVRLQALARAKLPEVEEMLRRAQLMRRLLRAAQSCQCPGLDQCLTEAQRAGLLAPE